MENTLKSLLKRVKSNESTISMLMGAIVVVVIGGLVVNYFRNKPAELPVLEDQSLEMADAADQEEFVDTPAEALPPFTGELPANYIVREGDNLWEIAERYYQTGYGWVEIAEANEMTESQALEKGQELVIPQLTKAYPLTVEGVEPAIGGGESTESAELAQADNIEENEVAEGTEEEVLSIEEPTHTAEPTAGPTEELVVEDEESDEDVSTEIEEDAQDKPVVTESKYGAKIEGDTYVIEKGDHLWGIAERAYGDPYRWTEIAEANNLENPSLIFSGNELMLPR